MATNTTNVNLQLSEGYRAARRITSILCALALAWSAAQFDFRTINLSIVGGVDLSRASIPLLLACAIAYTMTRLVLEFAMQPVEVRRWRYAQADFKLSVFLTRATALVLGASELHRSIDTVFYLALGVLGALLAASLAVFLLTMLATPLLVYIRSRQGRMSVASRAFEALAWAKVVVPGLLIVLLIGAGFASLKYEPLRSLWAVPPTPLALGIFLFTCIMLVASVSFQCVWYRKLFASLPDFTEERLPNGRIGIAFIAQPPEVWDWYIQPVVPEKRRDESGAKDPLPNKRSSMDAPEVGDQR